MKKINLKILSIVFLLITFIATFSSATYSTVTMSVVEEPVCTINFGTGSSVEKKLFAKDLKNKEVTLQLKVTNNEKDIKPTGEIMLVIDNSRSMLDKVTENKTREDLVIDSAKTLISNLLEDNTKLKIGVVSFSTNTDVSKEGTIEDAKLISDLSNDSKSLTSAVSNIEYNGPRTDLDAGIKLAQKYFTDKTDNSHKYVIILSDGVPNVAIDYDKTYYSDDVISKTKTSLKSLSSITTNVFTMLTGITDGDKTATNSQKTYNEIIQEIFGTEKEPTIGKFYYIQDDKIEYTIKDKIYKDLAPIGQSINNIKITDVFPKEIVDNFSFSYVKEANIGDISTTIDKSKNSITWSIPELKHGETAIVQYKLKLNEKFDETIVDKILNTNSKLDLTYTDSSNKENTKSSDVSPKIKLTEPIVEEEKPTIYPKAGKTIFIGILGLTITIAIIGGIRYFILKNKIK